MSDFRVQWAESDVAKVIGEVDLDTSPTLWEQLQDRLRQRPSRLVLDLADVRYIDSSGVAVLIQALKQAERSSTELMLRRPSSKVADVLALAQLTSLFRIEDE